ncbi:NAD-dependent epimerase/dehydratase family protein [candidate division WOR-3 bacterium]|nr:NAD-dependent epimerase/dehydratase family protein [candidate division WOR-3 bacterium]
MRNRVIVTGGAGFIGSHLVDRLISLGYKTLIIDNLSTGSKENINERAEFIHKDIRDEGIESLVRDYAPDYIFHLAAQIDVRKSLKDPLWDEDINIRGTLNLLKSASNAEIKKFIFASTGGAIYGEAINASENVSPLPLSPYGIAKLTCEHYLRVYSQWNGLHFTVLRYGNVYGPRQDPFGEAGVVAIFCRQLIKGETPVLYGYGKMIRDYVFVADVVEANINAIKRGDGSIYNIGTGKAISVNELFNILKSLSKRNIEPEYAETREGEVQEVWLNTQRALRELQWEPQCSLEEGLKHTYQWFKENNGR